jgi:hypothetical protein
LLIVLKETFSFINQKNRRKKERKAQQSPINLNPFLIILVYSQKKQTKNILKNKSILTL